MQDSKLEKAWAGMCEVVADYGARNVSRLREHYRSAAKLNDMDRVAVRTLAILLIRKVAGGTEINFIPDTPGPTGPLTPELLRWSADVDQRLAAARERLLPEGDTEFVKLLDGTLHPISGRDELTDEEWATARGLAVVLLDICTLGQVAREIGKERGPV